MLQCSWLTMCLFQVYGKVIQVFMYLFILKFFSYLGYYRTLSRAPWAMGFPGGSDGKESAFIAGDLVSIPGLGRSPRGGHGNPLQCSCLENPRDGGTWWAAVYGVTQSRTRLKGLSSSSKLQHARLLCAISLSLLKLMSIESVMPSNHLILCHLLLLLPSIFARLRVFSNELALRISSVHFSHSVVSDSLRPHGLQRLSFTISLSLLKLMSIKSVMPSNHLILCHPFLLLPSIFPSIRVFSNESALRIRWPKYWSFGTILPVNIQGWFLLRLTGFISLLSKGLSRVFSSTTILKHQFFGAQPFTVQLSQPYMTTGKTTHSFDYMKLCWQSDVSAF